MNKPFVGVKSMKKPPEVRQTLTSKYRLLKANPLLALEVARKMAPNGGAKEHLLKPLKTLVKAMDSTPTRTTSGFKHELNKTVKESSAKNLVKRESLAPPSIYKHRVIPQKNVKTIPKVTITTNSSKENGSQNAKPTEPKHNVLAVIQEVITPKTPKEMVFKTPATNRKSILLPYSEKKNSLLTPTSEEISRRLSDWIQKRGKNFEDYGHLKCFGINCQKKIRTTEKPAITVEQNKENQINQIEDANSTFLINEANEPKTIVIEVQNENLEFVAREALNDLYKLILEGYPPEQCEIWLKLIKQKYIKLEEEVQYWECRAALEQAKGNINSAVECCQTAIVQGAEVQQAEDFLEQLLQKFSLLNIEKNAEKGSTKEREKIVQEARNIFKSSIIQFAVQERKLKKKSKEGHLTIEKTLIATPVRRSTRLSRSGFTSTPGVKIYSSLKDLDSSIKEKLKFERNSAFKD